MTNALNVTSFPRISLFFLLIKDMYRTFVSFESFLFLYDTDFSIGEKRKRSDSVR